MSIEKKERIWLPDFIRGFAIIAVVLFHLVFNLNYFYGWESLKYYEGFWFYTGRIAALLFMAMVGVVSAIIFNEKGAESAREINFKRGFRLLMIAMGITLASWIAFPEVTVWFGILHLMGASIILSIPLAGYKWLNLFLACLIILLGSLFDPLVVNIPFMIPFGLTPQGFASLDYYPLFPWAGVILIGIGSGNLLYKKIVQIKSPQLWQKPFIYLGKNSLWIYLIHIPLLYVLLWFLLG